MTYVVYKQWTKLNLVSGVNLGYIRSRGVREDLFYPRPLREWHFQRSGCCTDKALGDNFPSKRYCNESVREKRGSYCICRHEKKTLKGTVDQSQEKEVNFGGYLTFMSCWCRLRAVKHGAMLGSPDSRGGEVNESLPQNMHLNCKGCKNNRRHTYSVYLYI